MAGVRAGLNGMAEGKMEASLAGTAESQSHPDGALRVEAIEAGVAFAHDYMEAHDGVPPTFSDCLEHFNQTDVYASTLPQEPGHINLRLKLLLLTQRACILSCSVRLRDLLVLMSIGTSIVHGLALARSNSTG